MDNRLRALAGRHNGVVAAAEAAGLGIDDAELRRAVARQELVRVRRGAYIDGRLWAVADHDERYRLTVLAVARTRPQDAVSHHAALALCRLPLWAHDPHRIDLVSDVRQVTSRRGLHLHPARGIERCVIDGVPSVQLARSIVRTAVSMGRDCAVVAGDAALRAELVAEEELLSEVALLSPHQGRARALRAVLAMDRASESVGESRTRLHLDDLGFGYDSQVTLVDAAGGFVARVDFLVEGVVLEFDGRAKYQRARETTHSPVTDPEQVLWLEKQREDRIRRLGHPVERLIWSELDRPGLLGARLRTARARLYV